MRGTTQPVRRPLPVTDTGAQRTRWGATRSLVEDSDHWVAPAAVRQAIGAWAYTLGPSERRPSEQAVREAVAVACAVRELSDAVEHTRWTAPAGAGDPEAGRALRLDVPALAACAGLGDRDVLAALSLLEQVGVVSRQVSSAGPRITLSDHVLTPQPGPSRVAWDVVRRRVRAVGGSVGPALAVLRELAAALGPMVGDDIAPVRLSVRDLEERTGFGRSTVAESLDGLARVRLLDVESRAGRTARFTLRPATFGLPDEAPAPSLAPEPRGAAANVGHVPAWTAPPAGLSHPPAHAPSAAAIAALPAPVPPAAAPGVSASVLLGEFAGTPIYGPPGTPLVVACDAEGRWTCQVGPFLRLGPAGA